MDKKKAEELLNKYNQGECTPEEKALVERWYHDLLAVQPYPSINQDPATQQAESLEALKAQLAPRPTKLQPYYWAAAAILLVALATALYFYQSSSIVNRKSEFVNDVPPGYNQATLTLGDGTKVELDSAQRGIIIEDKNIKYQSGKSLPGVKLSGEGGKEGKGAETSLPTSLTLSTPKGGQYQVILEDGTKVWLNAASTLKYPSRFSGNSREVFIEGEAFFEIKEDKTKPFKVISKNQEILVLGTSFNVAAYSDETNERTTLIEGKVRVKTQNLKRKTYNVKLLSPAQQAILNGDSLTVSRVTVESETAWRNNLFIFHNEPLESIMAKVARWYNVKIIYTYPEAKQLLFWGEVSRATPISSVLKNLEMTGRVHFNIEAPTGAERRVTVTK
ncbi:FecR family protein [bacterium A37T11]|nr:FecR family protein [bacterium A37T11]